MDHCFEPGQIIVLPEEGGPEAVLVARGEDKFPDVLATVDGYIQHCGALVNSLAPGQALADGTPLSQKSSPAGKAGGPGRPFLLRVPIGKEVESTSHFRCQKNVRAATPNFYVTPSQSPLAFRDDVIDDAIRRLDALPPNAQCGGGVTLAILDTGLDWAAMAAGPDPAPPQFDVDRPRRVTEPFDPIGHGTVVARIIRRIAPGARIVPVKVMEDTGTAWGLVCGLFVAEAHIRPDIYNLSLQVRCDLARCAYCKRGPGLQPAQLELLFASFRPTEASDRPAPLVVAAAGNGTRHLLMPALAPNTLAVGSYIIGGYHTPDYSRYDSVPPGRFLLAPGGRNEQGEYFATRGSRLCRDRDELFYGTSFAAAFASGIAACYLSIARGATPGPTGEIRPLSQPCGREFILDCLADGSERDFVGFDPTKHGLGVIRYNPSAIMRTMDRWQAGTRAAGYRAFVDVHRERLRAAVAGRAHEIFEQEQPPDGHADDHWRRALAELGLPEAVVL
jgi:hypothetical protein